MELLSFECPRTSLIKNQLLAQVMAWCHQATSQSLSQCWPIFMSPYGITRPNELNNLLKLSTMLNIFLLELIDDKSGLFRWWLGTRYTSGHNLNYNTRLTQKKSSLTQKCPVRHKNARFDTKMTYPGNPTCISCHCHYQTSPHLSSWEIFFPILFKYFIFKYPQRNKNEIILILKYI